VVYDGEEKKKSQNQKSKIKNHENKPNKQNEHETE